MEVLVDAAWRPELYEALPVEELARFVMEGEGLPANAEVSVSFVDDAQMARLNAEFRGKEGPTDVLSFECDGLDDGFDDFAGFGGVAGPDAGDAPDAASPADAPAQLLEAPYLLGDVVIAPDVLARQTQRFGTTFEGELSLLVVHGLLHLCGYDHIDDDEAREMEAREVELLEAWAARRGLSMDIFGQLNGQGARVRGPH